MNQHKSSHLYIVLLTVWALLSGLTVFSTWPIVHSTLQARPVLGVLDIFSLLFVGYFWLSGIKDVVYTLWYHCFLKRREPNLPAVRPSGWSPRVALVYCTFNDFNADSLVASMRQEYSNYSVVILDDSTDEWYKNEVDRFAHVHGVEVVRRENRIGFKAGNLNNYLQSAEYDYFVILDSDEIIPSHFVDRALDYFAARPYTGIVQANHRASRNRNPFMERFAIGVDSHWETYQTVKDRYGFMSLLGHGAMVSRECYETAGGFPPVVAEDICLSIQARSQYLTIFAPDIVCEEEFPVDFLAFRKRHNKWTQGNMEFIRKYTKTIFSSNMTWFEKLDVVLFTYSLPLTALFSVYVMVNVFVFPMAHYSFHYPLWMLAPTALFLIAPMLNDIWNYHSKLGAKKLISYLVHSTLLYGAMYWVSLRASVKSAFGKSTFLVTPKTESRLGFWQAIRSTKAELIFAVALSVAAIVIAHSFFAVLLIAEPAFFACYLAVDHHNRTKEGDSSPLARSGQKG